MAHTFQAIGSFSALDSSITEFPFIVLLFGGMIQGGTGPLTIPWPGLAVPAFSFGDESTGEMVIDEVAGVRNSLGSPLTKCLLKVGPADLQEMPENMNMGSGIVLEFFREAEP
ncbi:hypothetical protein GALMADRAFT_140628 [Galerina marginata CBS 339.88]|uniref:Uncharacterized protein n=1 Tax=Galerina marginata (strain CBS 339.88) TaxID=685588 RepID=A0A067T581_GALM3|nr:hypothetical protein GALMADRAFT_140628 [Galerina marginata CBS 339.88]